MAKKIKYKKGYKYQLAETYFDTVDIQPDENIVTDYIDLAADGTLTIKKGYAWDGPSGPTIDTKNFMRGSLVHDALYQLIRQNHISRELRLQADNELKRICLEDGMSQIRAKYVYWSVRKFAERAASAESVKEIIEAP